MATKTPDAATGDNASEPAELVMPETTTVLLQAPDGCTSLSIGGVTFDVPKSGLVKTPAHLVQDLLSHGFTDAKAKTSRRAPLEG